MWYGNSLRLKKKCNVFAVDHDGQHVSGAAAVSVLAAEPAERSAEAAADAATEHPPYPAATNHRQLCLQPAPDLLVQPVTNSHKRTCQLGQYNPTLILIRNVFSHIYFFFEHEPTRYWKLLMVYQCI